MARFEKNAHRIFVHHFVLPSNFVVERINKQVQSRSIFLLWRTWNARNSLLFFSNKIMYTRRSENGLIWRVKIKKECIFFFFSFLKIRAHCRFSINLTPLSSTVLPARFRCWPANLNRIYKIRYLSWSALIPSHDEKRHQKFPEEFRNVHQKKRFL